MSDSVDEIEEAEPRRFRRYPEYKDSRVEWLGEIPTHWSVLPLKRVSKLAYGDSLSTDNRRDGDIDVYGSNGPVGKHDRANTMAPCVIIGRKGSYGKVNYSNHPVFAIDTTFLVDRRYTTSNIRWLYYVLLAARLDEASKDSAIPGLDREDAYVRQVAICTTLEQGAKAAFLDRETAKIDGLVARKELLIELLQEKRGALITRAVTRGLDPNVRMKNSGVEWLGEIPAHWEIVVLKRLAKRIQTGSTPSTSELEYYVDGEVPWYGPGSFGDDLVLGAPAKLVNKRAVSDGAARYFEGGSAAIVTIGATVGKVGYMAVPGSCNQQITVVTFEEAAVVPKFGVYQLKRLEPVLREIAPSTTLPILDQEEVSYLPAVVPPLGEQRAIAAFLECETARIDVLIAKVREAIGHLKEFRTALISAAVTGKIDVREEIS